MRLLHTAELRFEDFFDSNIPPYAILSHRWGADEVSYQEFQAIRTSYVRIGLMLLAGYDPIPRQIDVPAYSHLTAECMYYFSCGCMVLIFLDAIFAGYLLASLGYWGRMAVEFALIFMVDAVLKMISPGRGIPVGIALAAVFYLSVEVGMQQLFPLWWVLILVSLPASSFPHYVEIFWPKTHGPGYAKILGCCKYAAADKVYGPFDWVWIDTCCIDKTSSSELSEAINSMYRWYETSTVCYAYFSDVPGVTIADGEEVAENLRPDAIQRQKSEALCASMWFTRGWTLQELLAPREMIFLDKNWNALGSRSSLAVDIARTTGISQAYIENTQLGRDASISTKFTWAARRRTSRLEDMAYCLLGLLDINMPLLYGEGASAFRRLQLELVRTKADESIFLWDLTAGSSIHSRPLLQSLSEDVTANPGFMQGLIAADIRSLWIDEGNEPKDHIGNMFDIARPIYSITNQGLELSVPQEFARKPAFLLPLNRYIHRPSAVPGAYAICLKKKGAIWVRSFNEEWKENVSKPSLAKVCRFRKEGAGLYIVPIEWVWDREDLERRGSEVIYVNVNEPNFSEMSGSVQRVYVKKGT